MIRLHSFNVKSSLCQKIVLFALVLFTSVCFSQDLKEVLDKIDKMTKDEMAKDRNQAACAVCVVLGDSIVFAKGYGKADIEKNIAATEKHIFRIGSITKQITGLMVLQMEEENKLKLTDKIETYFPEFKRISNMPSGSPPVTFKLLGMMTAGLAREPRNLSKYTRGPVSQWESILISALSDTRYDMKPGTRYQYSNIGYGSLGLAAARAGKTSFIAYTKDKTFKNLGMDDSDYDRTPLIAPMVAKGYVLRSSGPDPTTPEREHAGRGYKVPNGAMYASVVGFAKYLSFQLGYGPETVLKWDNLQKNYRSVITSAGSIRSSYGIGFMASKKSGFIRIGHSGSVSGYGSGAYVNRETLTGVAVFRSASSGNFSASGLASRALIEVANFRKGKVPPFVSIVNPLKNATISGSSATTVRAVAFDPDNGTDDGKGMEKVVFELLKGTTVAGTFTDNTAPYTWSISANNYTSGKYKLRATATSSTASGEQTAQSIIPVTIESANAIVSAFDKQAKPLYVSQSSGMVHLFIPYSQTCVIKVVDCQGRRVASLTTKQGSGWYPISLTGKGTGIYLLSVTRNAAREVTTIVLH